MPTDWEWWKSVYGGGWQEFFRYLWTLHLNPFPKVVSTRIPDPREIMKGTDIVEQRDLGGLFSAVAMSELEPMAAFWATGSSFDEAANNVYDLARNWFVARYIQPEEYVSKMAGFVWEGRVGPFNGEAGHGIVYNWKTTLPPPEWM